MAGKVLASLSALLTLNPKGFEQGLKKAKGSANNFQQSLSKIGPMIAGAFSVYAISNFVKDSVQAYGEQEKAEAKLLTALKGRKKAQEALMASASDLQGKTVFGDEATIEAYAQLAAFTQNEDAMRRLMPLIQDMATAMNMDLVQASQLVGKSLGSSTNALARYGIEIKGGVGSTERLESAVSALTDKFKGQAEAAANTSEGAVKQLSNAWGDFQEIIGKGVAPALTSLVKGLNETVTATNSFFSDKTMTAWQKFRVMIMGAAGDYAGAAKVSTDAIIDSIEEEKYAIGPAVDGYEEMQRMMAEAELKKKQMAEAAIEAAKALREESSATRKANEESMKAITSGIKPVSFGEVSDASIISAEQLRIMLAFKKIWEGRMTGMRLLAEDIGAVNMAMKDSFVGMSAFTDKFESFAVDVQAVSMEISRTLQNVAMSVIDSFGQMIEAMVAGEEFDFGASLLGAIGGFMKQLGEAMISIGVLGQLFDKAIKSMQWYVALAAGVALVAAGAVMSGIAQKGVKMASGGIVPGGFPNDTYPALLSSGETVLPAPIPLANKGGGNVVVLETKVRGEDLYILQKKTASKHNRYT